MIVYDKEPTFLGIELTKYTDPLNIYKALVEFKKEFNRLPSIIELCLNDRELGYITKQFRKPQYMNTNYLFKTDNLLSLYKNPNHQTNYGWFCEVIQHGYQDYLEFERGVLSE